MSDARRIRSALAYIKPDDWDTCVLVAKGIKHGLGDAGFEIWDQWVRQGGWFGSKATWQAPHDWIPPEERSHGL